MVRRPLLGLLAVACVFDAAAPAALASEPLERTFAERVALLAVDGRCALFSPPMRMALQAGASQARGALLRAGWTNARADALHAHAHGLVANRGCADPAVSAAERSAEAGFAGYRRLGQMAFPGAERSWHARRRADAEGWLVLQSHGDARFGLRLTEAGPQAAFAVTVDAVAPVSARLVMRDVRRAPASPLDIPGRAPGGLSHNSPYPAMAKTVFAQGRTLSAPADQAPRSVVIFSFPDAVLNALAALDPREAAVIELEGARGVERHLIEVGDLTAALAFVRIN
jgi:hypothetical protein